MTAKLLELKNRPFLSRRPVYGFWSKSSILIVVWDRNGRIPHSLPPRGVRRCALKRMKVVAIATNCTVSWDVAIIPRRRIVDEWWSGASFLFRRAKPRKHQTDIRRFLVFVTRTNRPQTLKNGLSKVQLPTLGYGASTQNPCRATHARRTRCSSSATIFGNISSQAL